MTLPKTLAAAIVSTVALSVAPAIAGMTDVQVQSKDVSVLGYDLADRSDAQQVLKKIETAAERVCTLTGARLTVQERVLRQRCADKAIDIAVNSLQSPTLSAVLTESRQR